MSTTTTTTSSTPTRSRPGDRASPTLVATAPRGSAKLRKVLFGAAVAVIPAGVGAVVGLLARSRKAGIIAGGVTAAGLGVYRWQLERTFNDEPDYEVENRIGDLEIRRYGAHVEAETRIPDVDVEGAIHSGFKRLADYIFGGNERREQLGMTTPVVSVPDGDTDHRISFVMPIHRTADSLPAPDDERIRVVEVPRRRVAVLCFRGKRDAGLLEQKAAELKRLAVEAGLVAKGEASYAGFDPPWTLPMLRRNEMWIEI